MTEPSSYESKAATTVSAMFTGASGENFADVMSWLTLHVPIGTEMNMGPMGFRLYVDTPLYSMTVEANSFVFVDGDEIRCLSKDIFKTLFSAVS